MQNVKRCMQGVPCKRAATDQARETDEPKGESDELVAEPPPAKVCNCLRSKEVVQVFFCMTETLQPLGSCGLGLQL